MSTKLLQTRNVENVKITSSQNRIVYCNQTVALPWHMQVESRSSLDQFASYAKRDIGASKYHERSRDCDFDQEEDDWPQK